MAHEDRGWACPQAGQKRRSQPGRRNMTKPTQLSRLSTNAFVFSSNVDGVDARPDWTSAFSGGSPQAHLAKAQRVQKHHGQGGQMWALTLKNTWKCCKSWGAQQTSQEKPRSHRHHVVRCGIASLAFQKRLIIESLMSSVVVMSSWTTMISGLLELIILKLTTSESFPWKEKQSVSFELSWRNVKTIPGRQHLELLRKALKPRGHYNTQSDLSCQRFLLHSRHSLEHCLICLSLRKIFTQKCKDMSECKRPSKPFRKLCVWQKRRRSWHRGQSCLKAGELVGDLSWELTPQKVGVHGPKTTLRDRWIVESCQKILVVEPKVGWSLANMVNPLKLGPRWSKMIQNGPRWSKMTRDCSERSKMSSLLWVFLQVVWL